MSSIYPLSTAEIRHKRRDLAPNHQAAFEAFNRTVFDDGAGGRSSLAVSSRTVRW